MGERRRLKVNDVKHLEELEVENGRLKGIVAEQALDIQGLKELARRTSEPGPESGGMSDPRHTRGG